MSKQSFTVLIMATAVLVGFGVGCGEPELTALAQAPALEQTSVARPLETISSDQTDSAPKSPGSNVPMSVERPAGKCCYANCGGDGRGYVPLRWINDGCNTKAAHWCASGGLSLIDAAWLPC